MKPVKLWKITDPETYRQLLMHIASSVDKKREKTLIGMFVEQAVREKFDR